MSMTFGDVRSRDGWVVLGDAAASRITDGHFGVVAVADGGCPWARHVLPAGQVAGRGTGSVDECVAAVEQRIAGQD